MTWKIVQLSEICEKITDGSHRTPSFVKVGYPFITVAHVDSSGNIDFNSCSKISEQDYKDLVKNDCRPRLGDVLFSKDGTVGKVAPVNFDKEFVVLSSLAILRPKHEIIDQKYLAYVLQWDQTLAQATSRKTGSALRRIILRDITKLRIPLPPLSEQRRIVDLLDQAAVLRKKRAEADAKADRILPALFYTMFGDPATNPKGWAKTPLKKLLRQNNGALQSGPFGTDLHNSDFVDDGTVLAVGIDNVHDTGFQPGRNRRITSEKSQQLKKYKLEPGDVLITIMGTIGRTCVFPAWAGEAICTKHVYRIQTNQSHLDPEYLCASMRFSPTVRAQLGASVTGQIVDGITSKDLKELIVEVPPLNLQTLFSQTKKQLDYNTVKRWEAKQKLDRLFSVLLQRAFSGDLTAKWRQAHIKELLTEMKEQAKALKLKGVHDSERQLSLYP